MVILTMTRFGQLYQFTHATVKDAARDACADVEANEAAPVSIDEDGTWVLAQSSDGAYHLGFSARLSRNAR